jgi:hypothetical protein
MSIRRCWISCTAQKGGTEGPLGIRNYFLKGFGREYWLWERALWLGPPSLPCPVGRFSPARPVQGMRGYLADGESQVTSATQSIANLRRVLRWIAHPRRCKVMCFLEIRSSHVFSNFALCLFCRAAKPSELGGRSGRVVPGPTQSSTPGKLTSPLAGKRTGKERLGTKWMDEQRVDNCKVPPELRGSKPWPDECAN